MTFDEFMQTKFFGFLFCCLAFTMMPAIPVRFMPDALSGDTYARRSTRWPNGFGS